MTDKYTLPYAELEKLARAATPGEWIAKPFGRIIGGPMRDYTNGSAQAQIASFTVTFHDQAPDDEPERQQANTEFCAAANPAVVLAMIAELRAARRAADQQAAGSVDTPEFRDLLGGLLEAANRAENANDPNLYIPARKALVSYLDSRAQPVAAGELRREIEKLTQWKYCMSYNDSYFGEPAGLMKRVAYQLERLLAGQQCADSRPAGGVTELLRRARAEMQHYSTCPADSLLDKGPCECYAGALMAEIDATLAASVAQPTPDWCPECHMRETAEYTAAVEAERAASVAQPGAEPVGYVSPAALDRLKGPNASAMIFGTQAGDYVPLYRAAPAGAAVPDGWRAIPIDATCEMVCAIEAEIDKQLIASGLRPMDMQRQDGGNIFDAMLAAAPVAPTTGEAAQ